MYGTSGACAGPASTELLCHPPVRTLRLQSSIRHRAFMCLKCSIGIVWDVNLQS
jgi:hypothetical protein